MRYRSVHWPCDFLGEVDDAMGLPFFEICISAGFPSPAEGVESRQLNLHEYLVERPAATFFIRVIGDSMIGAGIFSGDLLVVDRAAPVVDRTIVVASLDGEFSVKRLRTREGPPRLEAAHPKYPPLLLGQLGDFRVWGAVRYAIHRL